MFRRGKRRLSPLVVLLLVLLAAIRGLMYEHPPTGIDFDRPGMYRVERVVDGDTLVLAGGERVRLIGVDTPEVKHPSRPVEPLGPEASEFTRRHVEGRDVRLEFDRERRDRYDRVLAYVYVDDWFLNEELLRAGLGRAMTQFPYSALMKERFRAAELEARSARVGLWEIPASDAVVGAPPSPASGRSRKSPAPVMAP